MLSLITNIVHFRLTIVRRKLQLGEPAPRRLKFNVGDGKIKEIKDGRIQETRYPANSPERYERIQAYIDSAENEAQLIREKR